MAQLTLSPKGRLSTHHLDSQLANSPLITELVRLNYARASGTLGTAAGSTGAFAGGATNLSFSGGSGGDMTGGGGDQGILPIIKRRLSRLGSVEVMGQSNSLIITDVKQNVEAIRQLIAILDRPEPQVEIETRIVIAQHNFSRDLGAQLPRRRILVMAPWQTSAPCRPDRAAVRAARWFRWFRWQRWRFDHWSQPLAFSAVWVTRRCRLAISVRLPPLQLMV